MKRVLTIVFLVLATCVWSAGQITRFDGELRYEHQYEDELYNGQLSTSYRSSPIFSLGLGGILLSRRICDFNIHTALNLSYGTSHVRDYTLGNQQSYWNAYDLDATFFEFSPVQLQLAARDHLIENKLLYNGVSTLNGRNRSQEQRASLSINRVSFLPSINIFYTQNRTWSLTQEQSEQTTNQLSFALASGMGQVSSVNLSGSFSTVHERYTGFTERNEYLIFTGAKELSSLHRIDVSTEYTRYDIYGNLTGSVGYTGVLSDGLRITTGLFGTQSNSSLTTYRSVGASQGVNLNAWEYYRFGASLSGSLIRYASLIDNSLTNSQTFSSGVTAQHNRTFGSWTLTNGLSAGYSQKYFGELYHVWEGGISNNISTSIGKFALSGNYNFSGQSTRNGRSWYTLSNNAGLNASGTIAGVVSSHSALQLRSDNYGGEFRFSNNQRTLNLLQGFDGHLFYIIPMSLGLGGSVSWYSNSPTNRIYGWYFSFTSTSFFVRGLYLNYRYTRTFDPYYQRERVEHAGSIDYQWRSLSFHLNFRQATVPNRIRDVSFSVSRPF